jgi:hypothetical protein
MKTLKQGASGPEAGRKRESPKEDEEIRRFLFTDQSAEGLRSTWRISNRLEKLANRQGSIPKFLANR